MSNSKQSLQQLAPLAPLLKKQLLKRKLERSQTAFTKFFFRSRGERFLPGDHHALIDEALDKLERGELIGPSGKQCRNLLITIAPRFGKTQYVSIDWPARSIARNDRAKFIHLSYSDELALDNSAKCRETVNSDDYQKMWPVKIKKDSDSKKKWYTENGGGMYATAAGGAVTGFGAGSLADVEEDEDYTELDQEIDDFFGEEQEDLDPDKFYGAIIIDDPIKVDDADNEKERDRVNNRLVGTIASRRNSRNTPIVIVMQRLAHMDMAGFVLEGGLGEEFYHLNLPAIVDWKGENERSLWPAKHTLEELKNMLLTNRRVTMSQYMQDPTPDEGTFFEVSKIKRHRLGEEPTRLVKYGAGDFAVTADDGDWTEHGIAGFDYKDDLWFLDWFEGQVRLDVGVREMFRLMAENDPVLWMSEKGVIRRASEGYIEAEQRRTKNYFKIEWIAATQSKAVNAKAFQAMVEQGKVHVPYCEWGDALIEQLAKFTGKDDDRDDKVDVCGLFGRSLNQTFGPGQYQEELRNNDGDDYGYDEDDDTDEDWRI